MSLNRLRDLETYTGTPAERVHDGLADICDPFLLRGDGFKDPRQEQEKVLPGGISMREVARAARTSVRTATSIVGEGVVLKNDRVQFAITLGSSPEVRSVLHRAIGSVVLGQGVQTERDARRNVVVSLR